MTELRTINLDNSVGSADWTKTTWDLPPYKSRDFLDQIGGIDNLDEFRERPVYQHAVAAGLIHDDEWVGDFIETEGGSHD